MLPPGAHQTLNYAVHSFVNCYETVKPITCALDKLLQSRSYEEMAFLRTLLLIALAVPSIVTGRVGGLSPPKKVPSPKLKYETQGRNEIRWRPGQEASLAPPCSNLRSFGSTFTVLKKVLVTLLGLFGVPAFIRRPPAVFQSPQSDSVPGELRPLALPRYVPDETL